MINHSTEKGVRAQLSKIEKYFYDNMPKSKRDEAIKKATQDGFTQSEVAKFLGLTVATISKILKKLKVEFSL